VADSLVPFDRADAASDLPRRRQELHAFRDRQIWLSLAIATLGGGGLFASFSYITPTMTHLTGFAQSSITPQFRHHDTRLTGMAYRHVLVAYDGTSEGDEAIVAADLMARRNPTRLTIAVVVVLEEPLRWMTRWPRQTSVWNDVLLDRARADLHRAARLLEAPAELTVLFGPLQRALPEGAKEFDCDAIMLPPRPRHRLTRLLSRDHAAAIRRRTTCEVLQPR
jgi:nucleotide-binding universal stress UspA family protein